MSPPAPRLNLLTDVAGLTVGHATDTALGSGVTAVLFDTPAVTAVSVQGGAPGGRDTGMVDPSASIERIDGVVLSGGSTFGLDAAGGVQAALRAAGRGVVFAGYPVPLVSAAILFDLGNGGDKGWGRFSPYRDLGWAAAEAARHGPFPLGSVGAGTGATTATIKGGLGSASAVTSAGHTVAAIIACNAVGTPLIGDGPHFWAAAFEQDGEFGGLGQPATITAKDLAPRLKKRRTPATTIGLVATDAVLTRAQATRLAIMAHDGLARAVLPAHAPMDGDTLFATATGKRALADPLAELTELGHVATLVVARAIARGVHAATRLPQPDTQPAWRDRFGERS
jgi:L-aminopeptidase/D-esterase-like protein